mmetsp:Transcript_5210/g.15043  ORF Transcript_5210/g.15043 Transcript_5210/m.15043 type:complete len:271 (-) Transcript_5210:103-915(-)
MASSSLPHHCRHLIRLQIERCPLNPILRNDSDLHLVSRVNIPFPGSNERVLHDLHNFVAPQLPPFVVPVLVADDVVHEGDEERLARSRRAERRPFERSHGVVGVHGPLPLRVDTGEDVEGIIREESTAVQGVPQHLGGGFDRHGLAVVVLVHIALDVQHRPQLINVGLAPGAREDDPVGQFMQFRHVPRQYFIPLGESGVTGDDGVILPGYGEGRAAVEFVRGEAALVRVFGDAVIDRAVVAGGRGAVERYRQRRASLGVSDGEGIDAVS